MITRTMKNNTVNGNEWTTANQVGNCSIFIPAYYTVLYVYMPIYGTCIGIALRKFLPVITESRRTFE